MDLDGLIRVNLKATALKAENSWGGGSDETTLVLSGGGLGFRKT